MPNIGTLTVQLVAQATQFEKTMRQAQSTLEATAKSFARSGERLQSMGRNMMLGITAPLALIGGTAIKMAMDAVESENLFTVAMGDMADQARAFSEQLRGQLGLNAYEVRRNVATMFQMVSSMGIARNSAYEMSAGLTQLAYDMASFFNLQPDVAFEKLRSGIVGETKPLRELGVLVDDMTVKQVLVNKGLAKQGEQLTQQQKIMGRYLAIMEQTKNAQGDLARTINSPTNQIRILKSRLQEAAITLGMGLLPVLQSVLPTVRRFADALNWLAAGFSKLPAPVRDAVAWTLALTAAVGPALYAMGTLFKTASAVMRGIKGISALAGRASFAFAAWRGGAASLAEALAYFVGGKAKLIILAITGIVTITLLLASHWKQLSAVASAVWATIGAVVLYGASLVVRGVGLILTAVGAIIPAVRGAAQSVLGLADSLKGAASQSLASARSAMSMARTASQVTQNQSAMAQAGQNAADAQNQLQEGMENAAKAAANNIQSFDEVHQIQDEMANSPAAMAAEIPTVDLTGSVPGLGDIGSTIGQQMQSIADTAAGAWDRLKQAMEPVNRAVQWVKDNWPTIGPIVEGIASVLTVLLLPALIKTGVEALVTGGKVLASWAMQSAGAVAHGAVIVGQFAVQVAKWAWLGIEALANAGKVVLAWAMQGWQAVSSVATQVAQFALAGAKWLWLGVQAGIGAAQVVGAWVAQQAQAVVSVAAQVAQFAVLGAKWVWMGAIALANAAKVAAAWLLSIWPIALVVAAVAGLAYLIWKYWDDIKNWTQEKWSTAIDWLAAKWDWVKEKAAVVWGWISNNIISPIQKAWDWLKSAWSSIGDYLSNAWARIKDTAAKVWDGIARAVKSPINAIISAINWMIRGLNKINFTVPSWVPIFGGRSWGFNIPEIPLVPLAEGGIVTRPVTALVGEAGPEVVRPLEREEAMADQIAQAVYRAVVDALRITQVTSRSAGDREVVLKVDGATLARVLLPAMVREGQRIGMPVVVRPQGV